MQPAVLNRETELKNRSFRESQARIAPFDEICDPIALKANEKEADASPSYPLLAVFALLVLISLLMGPQDQTYQGLSLSPRALESASTQTGDLRSSELQASQWLSGSPLFGGEPVNQFDYSNVRSPRESALADRN